MELNQINSSANTFSSSEALKEFNDFKALFSEIGNENEFNNLYYNELKLYQQL